MAVVIGAWKRGTAVCAICGNDGMPMIQLDLDGAQQSAIVCALCVAEGLERASGWRLTAMFMQFQTSSALGEVLRERSPRKIKGRNRRPMELEGDTAQRPVKMTLAELRADADEAEGENEPAEPIGEPTIELLWTGTEDDARR